MAYTARVTKPYIIEQYPAGKDIVSGLITFFITAYYPFALSKYKTIEDFDVVLPEYSDQLKDHSGMIREYEMPTNVKATTSIPVTAQFFPPCI